MPRRSAAAVAESRDSVLDTATRRASIDGLEGLTIGRLAEEVAMSKSGLHGMFGGKQELQAAVFQRGVELFVADVWSPVERRDPGLPRLLALIDRWIAYHQGRALPGGCLVTTATIEFDARPGPLRDAVASARGRMHAAIAGEVRVAVEAGDVPTEVDPEDAAFALYAIASSASQAIQLGERGASARAKRAMRAVLSQGSASDESSVGVSCTLR